MKNRPLGKGRPRSNRPVNFALPRDLADRLKAAKLRTGINQSRILSDALKAYLPNLEVA